MVRIAIISDTHLLHRRIDVGSGDLLIHCGDLLDLFEGEQEHDLADVDEWFGTLDFERIICIGGNHDFALQEKLRVQPQPFRNALYLQDSGFEFAGLHIHGSPWVPELSRHAFFASKPQLEQAWAAIPDGLDILVTHAPPAAILDRSSRGRSLGCPLLAARVAEAKPRVHCFGHVHASAGEERIGATHFINASSVVSGTDEVRPPVMLTL